MCLQNSLFSKAPSFKEGAYWKKGAKSNHGLFFASFTGIAHRDLKPENILCACENQVIAV